jgi:hypothetical protein
MLSPYPETRSTVRSSAIKNKLREFMITIVSELPRPGTSLRMQISAAGGMPILSDGERRLTRIIREAISGGSASSSFRKTRRALAKARAKP